ncbi:hypothetical protein LTR16_001262 [Cryomyces antarcticus]|uniref:Uncharacterized protein n=1 Tax=Cryomyces antarcticus TaxID=329879 RepID=A0ABR0LQD0_9PEZI|nr:hypothetical protein LTR60_002455 [Cryomyces antarcticus]KAK5017137.1 hypothetical protein LTR39_001709 [Cryomyces antarcticus]KAK5201845.1 hypothetical protein LTR16_001262 [Cryomyces antarcticus]
MGTKGRYSGYKRSGSQYVDEKGTPDQSRAAESGTGMLYRALEDHHPGRTHRLRLRHRALQPARRPASPEPGLARIGVREARSPTAPSSARPASGPPSRATRASNFSRPNGHVPLRSLFAGPLQDGEERPLTADERIAERAVLRSTANYKGTETFDQSSGTEHTKGRGRATLDAPRNEIEAA